MSEILKDTTANTIGTGSGGLKLDPAGTDIVTIGNGVMLPDGVKTAPAIRFTDDNNTGIYSPVNDQVSITGQGEDALLVTGVASSVNVIEVKPSATGSPVEINATGTDTNISVNVTPKGTGTLKVAGTDVSLSGHTHTGVYEPADATILKDADIGVTVQAYDATIVVDADIGVSVAAQGHNHDSAYVSVVTTPTTGNFPVLTTGGELDNSSYSAASFATAAHNHTGTYEPANANIQSHVSSTSNPHSVTAAQVGAYTSGAVDTLLTGKSDTSHSHTIDGLSDVTITTPSTGQVIKYNGTAWINDTDAAGTSAAWGSITGTLSSQTDLQSALDGKSATTHDHTGVYQPADADLTSIAGLVGTSGFLTKTAADTWALDTTAYSTTAHSHTLDGLSDVTITTPASGHVLSYNGSAWVNSAPGGSGGATYAVGTIIQAPAAPSDGGTWLECNGAAASQTTYASLFGAIGHRYAVLTLTTASTTAALLISSNCGGLVSNGTTVVAFRGGLIAGVTTTNFATSTDMVNWTAQSSNFTTLLTNPSGLWTSASGGYFMFFGTQALLNRSPDGVTWAQSSLPAAPLASDNLSVTAADPVRGRVAYITASTAYYSDNAGTSWTAFTGLSGTIRTIGYSSINDKWYIINSSNTVYEASGTTTAFTTAAGDFPLHASGLNNYPYALSQANGKTFLATGSVLMEVGLGNTLDIIPSPSGFLGGSYGYSYVEYSSLYQRYFVGSASGYLYEMYDDNRQLVFSPTPGSATMVSKRPSQFGQFGGSFWYNRISVLAEYKPLYNTSTHFALPVQSGGKSWIKAA